MSGSSTLVLLRKLANVVFIDSFALDENHPDLSMSQIPKMYISTTGLETSCQVAGHTGTLDERPASRNNFGTYQTSNASVGVTGEIAEPTKYPRKAKAIYTYIANPQDDNEISFTKGEEPKVTDMSGRWWQARKRMVELRLLLRIT